MEIKRTYNPLTLRYDSAYGGDGLSPNQIIEQENLIFLRPVVLLKSGQAVLRKDWDDELNPNDVCYFVELPGVEGLIAIGIFLLEMAVGMAISYGLNLLLNMWFGPDEHSPSQVDVITQYNLTANRNVIQIGHPYIEHFGRFLCFPHLLQRSYTEYIDNIQYQYTVGIIGIGEYDIENIFIDKTPIDDYSDITYNIISPSGALTLCPNLVWMASSITGQELTDQWLTSAVTPAGTEVSEIGFDVIFPSGLYHTNRHGHTRAAGVVVQAECRLIENDGTPLENWAILYYKSFALAITSAQRYSLKAPVPQGVGRYEFRVRRESPRRTEVKYCDYANIEFLKGYGAAHPEYEGVTLIELKIKATDQLNGDVNNKINVVCTRKLYPVTATGFGETLTASRSIVDACAYIVTSDNGGQQNDDVLDFETLNALNDILAARPNYFDFRFQNKGTVFEACKKIAKCGRSVPIMPGGLFSMVRDKLQVTPTQIYTDDDYTKGSLSLNHFYRTDDSPTYIEVSYVDSTTWQSQTIDCVDVGGSYDTPAKINLEGCTDRQHAYEEGMYAYWDDELNRTTIAFTTGLKGLIPRVGDMVYVASRQVDWGQTGLVAHLDSSNVWLSEPVDFGEASEAKLILTHLTDGSIAGPFTVNPGDTAHDVSLSISSDVVRTIHTDGLEATKYVFGITTEDLLRVRILKIVPHSNNEIKIEGNIIHDDVHEDPGTAPSLITPEIELPILSNLIIQYYDETAGIYSFHSSWLSSETEFRVELDEGSGYSILANNLIAYSYGYTSTALETTLKITPYIDSVLTPAESETATFTLLPAPGNVQVSDDGTDLTVTWDAVASADGYELLAQSDGEDIWGEVTELTTLSSPVNDVVFEVNADTFSLSIEVMTRKDGNSGPASSPVLWGYDAPPAPSFLTAQYSIDSAGTNYDVLFEWESLFISGAGGTNRITGYVMYTSAVSGFDPGAGEGTLYCEKSGATGEYFDSAITVTTAPIYFRVAGITSNNNPVGLNFSSQLNVSLGEIPEGDLIEEL